MQKLVNKELVHECEEQGKAFITKQSSGKLPLRREGRVKTYHAHNRQYETSNYICERVYLYIDEMN